MQFIGRLAESEQVPVSRTISRFARYGLRSPSCRQKRTVASGNPRKRSALRFLQMPSNQRVSEFDSTFRFGFIARCGYDGVKSTENLSLYTLADLYDPENFD